MAAMASYLQLPVDIYQVRHYLLPAELPFTHTHAHMHGHRRAHTRTHTRADRQACMQHTLIDFPASSQTLWVTGRHRRWVMMRQLANGMMGNESPGAGNRCLDGELHSVCCCPKHAMYIAICYYFNVIASIYWKKKMWKKNKTGNANNLRLSLVTCREWLMSVGRKCISSPCVLPGLMPVKELIRTRSRS